MKSQESFKLEAILKKVVREISCSRLKSLSHLAEIDIQENEDVSPVWSHRMVVIMVSGRDVRLTFKAQFCTESARVFANKVYQSNLEEISVFQAEDFMREYANVVAGRIKTVLNRNSLDVGVSLPTVARGFDNIFFREPAKTRVSNDYWKLVHLNSVIFCSIFIEILKEFEFKAGSQIVEDEGEVQFL
jgi:CheY-specific phosphatase CheX